MMEPGIWITTKVVGCSRGGGGIPAEGTGTHEVEICNSRTYDVAVRLVSSIEPPGPLEYRDLGDGVWDASFKVGAKGSIENGDCLPLDEKIYHPKDGDHAPGNNQAIHVEAGGKSLCWLNVKTI